MTNIQRKRIDRIIFISIAALLVLILAGVLVFLLTDKPGLSGETVYEQYADKQALPPFELTVNVNWRANEEAVLYREKTDGKILYYVTADQLVESLGGSYSFKGTTAKIKAAGRSIEIKAGVKKAVLNGKKIDLIRQPLMYDDRLIIDEQIIAALFEAKTGALPELYIYNISTEENDGKIGEYNGRNVFFIKGEAYPANSIYCIKAHQNGVESWGTKQQGMIKQFAAAGYDIMTPDIFFQDLLKENEQFDMDTVHKMLAGYLKANPNARLLVRLDVSLPHWWIVKNNSERVEYAKEPIDFDQPDDTKNALRPSFASEKCREYTFKKLEEFLNILRTFPESDRIIGFHLGGGAYGEWHPFGLFLEPDTGDVMREYFQKFLREKYTDIASLNAAWGTKHTKFENITVPDYNTRISTTDGDFRDPAKERYMLDYLEAHHKVVTDLVEGYAKYLKENWGRNTIVGIFWAYMFDSGSTGAIQSQGDVERMIKSPYIDYFSGPYMYTYRDSVGGCYLRSIAESCNLNGKIWLSENDMGSHLEGISQQLTKTGSPAESVALMKRTFAYTFTENCGQWWYDFGSGSGSVWNSSNMQKSLSELLNLSKTMMESQYRKNSDVLLVYDMNAYNYMKIRFDDMVSVNLLDKLTNNLQKVGASYDRIFLFDLEKVNIKRYKMVIFVNDFEMTEIQRKYIKDNVIKDGRSVLFLYGAGYTDGIRNDTAFISDLTGMFIKKETQPKNTLKLDVNLEGMALSLYCRDGIETYFSVDDISARVLGSYDNGTAGFASKNINNSTVYFMGMPFSGDDVSFLRELLIKAGVKIWAQGSGSIYVSVGGGIISVYSCFGSEVILTSESGGTKKVILDPKSTVYYDTKTLEVVL